MKTYDLKRKETSPDLRAGVRSIGRNWTDHKTDLKSLQGNQILLRTSARDNPEQTGAVNLQLKTESGGTALPEAVRSFFEPRFGFDFSSVRLHTGSIDAAMAASVNARAFTYGRHIVFGSGEYRPETEEGRRLIGHELVHVVQQGNDLHDVIRRACSAEDQPVYDRTVADIRQLALYQRPPYHADALHTPGETKRIAERIMTNARSRDNCLYYVQNLQMLFSTPETPAANVAAQFGPVLAQAAQDEQSRLADPAAQAQAGFEEGLTNDPTRRWERIAGSRDMTGFPKHYFIDRSDLSNIFVKVAVRPRGRIKYVDQVKQLEDAIEKESSVLGYTVNLSFTATGGSNVFETNVDPSQWPTSGNWVGDAPTLAHELHHMLGLDDRYNYIESHSGNPDMYIANRIHWFQVEFDRQPDPMIRSSFMGEGTLVTDQDICEVAQSGDVAACVSRRASLRSSAQLVKARANGMVQRLIEVISGIIPPSLLDPRADASTLPTAQARVRSTAELVFGGPVSDEAIRDNLSSIRNQLIMSLISMENPSAPQCANRDITYSENPPAFVMCPSFASLDGMLQIRKILETAVRLQHAVSFSGRLAASAGLSADPDEPVKWARFIIDARSRIS